MAEAFPKPPARPRVLAVDDDPAILESVRESLKREYDVFTATDEQSCFDQVEDVSPDLIILDVSLGSESGVNLCYALRKNPATRDIPVLMLTGLGFSEMRELAFSAGADDFVEKPVTPTELKARVRSKLERWQELRGQA